MKMNYEQAGNRRVTEIVATCSAWAQGMGVEQPTLIKMLQRAGVPYISGTKLNFVDIWKAISFRSEKDEAMARQANAKAEEIEMDNAARRKELMDVAQIQRIIWNDLLGPLRQELEQMPKNLGGLCNPDSPDTACAVLTDWVEATKQQLERADKK